MKTVHFLFLKLSHEKFSSEKYSHLQNIYKYNMYASYFIFWKTTTSIYVILCNINRTICEGNSDFHEFSFIAEFASIHFKFSFHDSHFVRSRTSSFQINVWKFTVFQLITTVSFPFSLNCWFVFRFFRLRKKGYWKLHVFFPRVLIKYLHSLLCMYTTEWVPFISVCMSTKFYGFHCFPIFPNFISFKHIVFDTISPNPCYRMYKP